MTMTDLGAKSAPIHSSACVSCGAALRMRFDKVVDPQSLENFTIVECVECGLGHTDPQPADLAPYYGARYHGGRHSFTDQWCTQRRLGFLKESVSTPGKLLDVGCGDGRFLEAAREKGWEGFGVEMNPEPPRSKGFTIERTVEELAHHGPFDAITFWHSLEHFRNPREAVEAASKVLRPGGKLIIAVPDAGGAQARMWRRHWFHLDVPRHLFHFTASSLESMLTRASLRVSKRWHQEIEIDVFGWIQSPLNAAGTVPNALFDTLTKRPTPASALSVVRDFAFATAIAPAATTASVATAILGQGGTLIVACDRVSA
ncbi:MAG: class I SAM-dependent methyltransferase [Archangium sp.]|nr:class I SAM-dependent methyltransferase [Archangium sp.]